MRPPADAEPDKHAYREQLFQSDPDIQQAYTLTVEFEELVRGRERSWSSSRAAWSGTGRRSMRR